jgi:hypothetical protein
MTSYRVAENHNVVLGSLTVIDPPPDPGEGIKYLSIIRAAGGTLIKQGPYFEFEWTQLENADYVIITGLFGVDTADTANVTIYIRDETYQTWTRYNGIAQRPFPGDSVEWDVRPNNVVIRVTDLVASS